VRLTGSKAAAVLAATALPVALLTGCGSATERVERTVVTVV
jgi:hypothetical protein